VRADAHAASATRLIAHIRKRDAMVPPSDALILREHIFGNPFQNAFTFGFDRR
jgi:hypothetical protein